MFLSRLNEVLASKNNWKTFVSDRLNFFSLGLALLINIIQWAFIYFKLKPSGQNVLLHFNVIYGTDLVDKDYYIYLIPGIALACLLANLIISYVMFQKEKLASYFLNISTIPIQIIFFVAGLILVFANN